jgi:hypothetical protein
LTTEVSAIVRERIAAAKERISVAMGEVETAMGELTVTSRFDKRMVSNRLRLAMEELMSARASLAAILSAS